MLSEEFRPPADDQREFEVEDLLDHRPHQTWCHASGLEYLVKWRGYSVFEATWEPASNLTNCSEVLSAYRQRRGLR